MKIICCFLFLLSGCYKTSQSDTQMSSTKMTEVLKSAQSDHQDRLHEPVLMFKTRFEDTTTLPRETAHDGVENLER